jgi:hypothetical protein
VHKPNPAIVSQSAAIRFPRIPLLLLCAAYVLSGFFGRDAWKSEDMAALGYMAELANGTTYWLKPTLMGASADNPALLPYWIGAVMLQMTPDWIAADFSVRIPFGMLLAIAMLSTWYATYYLARSPQAQPVAFAFGGEALPKDYSRAVADGGVLAFMACLGLAQLSHETTPALVQLSFSALLFYGLSALPFHRIGSRLAIAIGMTGLTLSGAPMLTVLFGVGGAILHYVSSQSTHQGAPTRDDRCARDSIEIVFAVALVATLAATLGLWYWKVILPKASMATWLGFGELLIWFTWPAWPLVLWTLWNWRRQLFSTVPGRHLALPAWFCLVTVIATFTANSPDRTLLVALPALATLAAFALPTLKRQVAALIDWFTLLFFSGCGITIWVVWISNQTGFPRQPAANVARLAPGFEASFSWLTFGIAVMATLAWAWLVRWRIGRNRAAIWKSLVLPAGGATLCWLLLMTLWMPLLNYAQSYTALVQRTKVQMNPVGCAEALRLSHGQIAAFQFYGQLTLAPVNATTKCNWLLTEPPENASQPTGLDHSKWVLHATVLNAAGNESVLLYKRRRAE